MSLAASVLGLMTAIGAPATAASCVPSTETAQADAQPDRTKALTKIDTSLRNAIERLHTKEKSVEARPRTGALDLDESGRPLVDIDARVSPELRRAIEAAGGLVISEFPAYNSIRARLPLAQVERLAERADVKFVRTADQATTNPSSGGVR